jgi:hypothetical protein
MIRASIWTAALGMFSLVSATPAAAQDMMRHIDLTSPEMTSAEMTRADVEALIAAATSDQPADFTGKKLSGLDLSGLDFSGASYVPPGSTGPNSTMQSSTERYSIRLGFWKPISAGRASGARTSLLHKCSAQNSMEPISRAHASPPI